jgi:hypothetical protein
MPRPLLDMRWLKVALVITMFSVRMGLVNQLG